MDTDGANAWLDNIRTRCHVEKQAAAMPANDNDWLVKQQRVAQFSMHASKTRVMRHSWIQKLRVIFIRWWCCRSASR